PGHLLEKELGVDDLEVKGSVSAKPHHPKVLIPHHHRIGSAPLVPREEASDHEVDVRLEGRLKTVLPTFQIGEHGDVLGHQGVLPGPKRVPDLAQIAELRHLRLATDQLRSTLDLLVLIREAKGKRVTGVVLPLDDVQELLYEKVDDAHRLLRVWGGTVIAQG